MCVHCPVFLSPSLQSVRTTRVAKLSFWEQWCGSGDSVLLNVKTFVTRIFIIYVFNYAESSKLAEHCNNISTVLNTTFREWIMLSSTSFNIIPLSLPDLCDITALLEHHISSYIISMLYTRCFRRNSKYFRWWWYGLFQVNMFIYKCVQFSIGVKIQLLKVGARM
jgi:hypothetical protein